MYARRVAGVAEPNYHYRYAVASRKTGDVKGAWEKRSGEDVWGAYFLRDPDGHWRTVHYEADSSGFYATVQRRPLYGHNKGKLQPGEMTDADQHQDLEHQGGALELDEAAWQDALLAAKESASEDNHPALQKAKKTLPADETLAEPYQLEESASERSYTSTRTPSSGSDRPPVDKRSYSTRPRPASYTQTSTTLRPTSYSTPPSSYYAGESHQNHQGDEDAPYDSGSAATHARQPYGEGASSYSGLPPSSSYSAPQYEEGAPSYSSSSGRPRGEDDRSYDESSSNYSEQPSGEGSSNAGSSSPYSERPSDEESDSDERQYDRQVEERPTQSEQYRVSEDLRHQDDDGGDRDRPNAYGHSVDDREQQGNQEDEDRGEADDKENEHNPDDDHELVPEQALQGSGHAQTQGHPLQFHRPVYAPESQQQQQIYQQQQLAQLHSAHMQQAAELRVPVGPPQQPILVHGPQHGPARGPAQAQHGGVMEQLLGPAWGEVAGFSKLFEGNDWPGMDRPSPSEVTAQDSQDVPTWVKKERAKARRTQQSKALQGAEREREWERERERERGPGRYGTTPLTAARLTVARPSTFQPATPSSVDLVEAPRPTADWGPQWSFGSKSKVRGKEEASHQKATVAPAQQPQQQQQQQQGHKRGAVKGHNRGPVLFGHALHLSASTPAGDRRAPPKGYVPQAAAPWLHSKAPSRQHPRGLSYAGWVPVSASLQVGAQPLLAPSFGEKKSQADALLGRPGRTRGPSAGASAAAAQELPGAANSAWRPWN
ncbi:ataxin-2 homolog [Frankliniella occidentalis]|uniref:Ataxin-2 homolog n=1 Tax=Frankliniella occidentalis TaxID=133901 RepID=A0A9C6XV11_FRAOC|nr:ataxin-2 homolog [Frankliniella occidentalis]